MIAVFVTILAVVALGGGVALYIEKKKKPARERAVRKAKKKTVKKTTGGKA